MEIYLLRREEWEKFYNCNRINVDDVPFSERYHPLNGTIIVGLFVIFETLYLPCLFAIYKHTEHSCYKLLLFIGISDMLMLLFHGLESGIYSFTGEMFCPNYNFNYVTGSFGAALFALETSANIFLALDRCCDFISPKLCEFLFNGKRITFWIGFSIIFSFYYFFYVNPAFYNSVYMNWFMNPYQSYSIESTVNLNDYINPITFWYNMFLTFGFPIIYLIYICFFIYRLREIKAIVDVSQRKWKITMFIQVAIICGINIACCSLYAIMQRLPMSKTLIIIGYYLNYFVFGLPPFIYLFCNETIRNDVKKIIGKNLHKLAKKLYSPPNSIHPSYNSRMQRSVNRPLASRFSGGN
uniref:G_PROTEIN_RECEP_F1_2 domain-containing protein n=1 Tax=Meloidogyne incognita TaxID=6306 RepID=A0A914N973_MELIC